MGVLGGVVKWVVMENARGTVNHGNVPTRVCGRCAEFKLERIAGNFGKQLVSAVKWHCAIVGRVGGIWVVGMFGGRKSAVCRDGHALSLMVMVVVAVPIAAMMSIRDF